MSNVPDTQTSKKSWASNYAATPDTEPIAYGMNPADPVVHHEAYPVPDGPAIPDWTPEEWRIDFEESWLHNKYEDRILEGTNDLIICVAAAAISSGSGSGKTTLAMQLCRKLDASNQGFNAEHKSTLKAREFSREILNNPEEVENRSAILFDEATGTLSDAGADKRRSMQNSVMDVTKSLATLRYRQCTAILVAQSTGWLDDRLRDVIDVLILIQQPGEAVVFHPFRNDLQPSKKYNSRKGKLTWDPLPNDGSGDPDYEHLETLKRESTKRQIEEQEEDLELSRDQKIRVGRRLREKGVKVEHVADAVEMSTGWVSDNCSA